MCSEMVAGAVFVLLLLLVSRLLLWRSGRMIADVASKSILVTGCDTGFGKMLVRRLDALGCQVFAGCLTESGQLDLRQISSARVKVLGMDVTDSDSVCRAYEYIRNAVSSEGLWGLVNNAAIAGVSAGPLEWQCADDFRKVLDVNLVGLIDVTLTFLPLLKRSRGRIVNMSSTGGRLVGPLSLPYDVSKHGVEAFSDGLRRHLKLYECGISVHVIQPSIFKTEMLDPEKNRRLFELTWRRLTTKARELFGEKFYSQYVSHSLESMDRFASTEYSKVIDAYTHSLLSSRPRLRYSVGYRAIFFSLPLSHLPSSLVDWIVCHVHPKLQIASPDHYATTEPFVNNRNVRFTSLGSAI